ncbi:MAG: hypothetical protein HQM10_17390 [Candidatus Riflebacteria bacterium]|nr:hypothetical protein [Candidatus Riflebacteria bacterium]
MKIDLHRVKKSFVSLIIAILLTFVFNGSDFLQAKSLRSALPADTVVKGFFLANIGDLQVIFPECGKSKKILLALSSDENLSDVTSYLKLALGCKTSGIVKTEPLIAENKFEEDLIANFPDRQMLCINAFLPEKIRNRFNRKFDFGGPNCFYTALSATDGIADDEIRHVSFDEFKARMTMLYHEIQTDSPEPGDVLLYNSSDHGAVYLGGDRVFHKKDLHKEFYQRMPRKLEVFKPDPGEWAPGPHYEGPYSIPGDKKISKIQVFRRNKTNLDDWKASIEKRSEFRIVNLMKKTAMITAPKWDLGKILGYWSEVLSEELVRALDGQLKTDDDGRRLMSELSSVRDQIFISIEDGYFSTPYASKKIIKEIWFFENDYAFEMIRTIREYYGLQTNEETLKKICSDIKAIEGELKGKSLLTIIRS